MARRDHVVLGGGEDRSTLYRAHYQAAHLHEKLDEPEQADQGYRKCIELNAKYSPCFVALGNMYIDYGFSNVAMSVLETGTEVNDTDADMWNGMGRALLNLNRPKEAVEAYKKAKRIDPDKPDVLFGLGMAYAEIPMRKEAEDTLNEFINKAADSPEHIKKAPKTRSCGWRAPSERASGRKNETRASAISRRRDECVTVFASLRPRARA